MLDAVWNSFVLVALSEMGDKTQLLAFSLAARFKRPWPIFWGILAATLLNHGLASWAGSWAASLVRADVLGWVVGLSFIGFGIWTLIPDRLDEPESVPRYGPFVATTVLFFLAEMGDKTQLATVALGARFHSVLTVTAGTTLGMLFSDGLAVFLGNKFSTRVQMPPLRIAAAVLFFIFGLLSIFTSLRHSA